MKSIACGIACPPAGGNPAAIERSIKMRGIDLTLLSLSKYVEMRCTEFTEVSEAEIRYLTTKFVVERKK